MPKGQTENPFLKYKNKEENPFLKYKTKKSDKYSSPIEEVGQKNTLDNVKTEQNNIFNLVGSQEDIKKELKNINAQPQQYNSKDLFDLFNLTSNQELLKPISPRQNNQGVLNNLVNNQNELFRTVDLPGGKRILPDKSIEPKLINAGTGKYDPEATALYQQQLAKEKPKNYRQLKEFQKDLDEIEYFNNKYTTPEANKISTKEIEIDERKLKNLINKRNTLVGIQSGLTYGELEDYKLFNAYNKIQDLKNKTNFQKDINNIPEHIYTGILGAINTTLGSNYEPKIKSEIRNEFTNLKLGEKYKREVQPKTLFGQTVQALTTTAVLTPLFAFGFSAGGVKQGASYLKNLLAAARGSSLIFAPGGFNLGMQKTAQEIQMREQNGEDLNVFDKAWTFIKNTSGETFKNMMEGISEMMIPGFKPGKTLLSNIAKKSTLGIITETGTEQITDMTGDLIDGTNTSLLVSLARKGKFSNEAISQFLVEMIVAGIYGSTVGGGEIWNEHIKNKMTPDEYDLLEKYTIENKNQLEKNLNKILPEIAKQNTEIIEGKTENIPDQQPVQLEGGEIPAQTNVPEQRKETVISDIFPQNIEQETKETKAVEDIFINNLNNNFETAKKEKKLFDVAVIDNIINTTKSEDIRKKANEIKSNVIEYNKKLQDDNELTPENLSKKKFKKPISQLTEDENKELNKEYNSMVEQGITTFKPLETFNLETTKGELQNASKEQETEQIPELEVRTQMGEGTRVRQPNEGATREGEQIGQLPEEERKVEKEIALEKEKIDTERIKKDIEDAGGIYEGIQEYEGQPNYAVFTDPQTKSTYYIPVADVNKENVIKKIETQRAKFEKPKEEEVKTPSGNVVEDLRQTINIDDIPEDLSTTAYSNTSFSPEKRGREVREGAVKTLNDTLDDLSKVAVSDEQKKILAEEFPKFKEQFINNEKELLRLHSNLASPMITGGSKFPTSKMEERNKTYDKRSREISEWKNKAVKSIKKKLEAKRIEEAGGEIEVAKNELKNAENLQTRMVNANKIIKDNKLPDEVKITKLKELNFTDKEAGDLLKPDFAGRIGFPDYALKNNSAKINRLKEQIKTSTTKEEVKSKEIERIGSFKGGEIINNYKQERIQIQFDNIPDTKTRDKLKSNGWHWSPQNKSWQRKNTENALSNARDLLDNFLPEGKREIPKATIVEQSPETKSPEGKKEYELSKSQPAYDIDVNDIEIDLKKFQNRLEPFSKKTYDSIVDDVRNGTFNISAMPAIKVWREPETGKLYALNHSRLKAFQDLYQEGYKQFGKIPANIFQGTLEEAIDYARFRSNETNPPPDVVRAREYRDLREKGISKAEIRKKAERIEKNNANYIINLSYLEPDGKAMSNLIEFADSEGSDVKQIQLMADWVGEARKRFPELNAGHEDEMYDWLKTGNFKKVNKGQFLTKISNIVSNFNFSPEQALNINNRIQRGYNEKNALNDIDKVREQIRELENERDNEKNPPSEQRLNQITEEIKLANKELSKLYFGLRLAKEGDRKQGGLFDLVKEDTEKTVFNDKRGDIAGGVEITKEVADYFNKKTKIISEGNDFNFSERKSVKDRELIFGSKEKQNKTKQDLIENIKNKLNRFEPEYEKGVPIPKKLMKGVEINNVLQEIVANGGINYVGTQLSDNYMEEIADLYYVARNPTTESSIFIGRDKNNKIIANVVLSSGAANYVKMSSQYVDSIIKAFKERGVTNITFVHNHPSGNPTPSNDDYGTTAFYRAIAYNNGIRLDSSIVINGDRYAGFYVPEGNGEGSMIAYYYKYNSPKTHPLDKFYEGFDAHNKIQINNNDAAAKYFSQLKYGKGNIAVVVINPKYEVLGYEYIHKNEFDKDIGKKIEGILKSYGGSRIMLVGNSEDMNFDIEQSNIEGFDRPIAERIIYSGNEIIDVKKIDYENKTDKTTLADVVYSSLEDKPVIDVPLANIRGWEILDDLKSKYSVNRDLYPMWTKKMKEIFGNDINDNLRSIWNDIKYRDIDPGTAKFMEETANWGEPQGVKQRSREELIEDLKNLPELMKNLPDTNVAKILFSNAQDLLDNFAEFNKKFLSQWTTPPPTYAYINKFFKKLWDTADKYLSAEYVGNVNEMIERTLNNFKDLRNLTDENWNDLEKKLNDYFSIRLYLDKFNTRNLQSFTVENKISPKEQELIKEYIKTELLPEDFIKEKELSKEQANLINKYEDYLQNQLTLEQFIKEYKLNPAQEKVVRQLDDFRLASLDLQMKGEKEKLFKFKKNIKDLMEGKRPAFTVNDFIELFPEFKEMQDKVGMKITPDIVEEVWEKDLQRKWKIADFLVEKKYKDYKKYFYLNLSRPMESNDYIVNLQKEVLPEEEAQMEMFSDIEIAEDKKKYANILTYFGSKVEADAFAKEMFKKGWEYKQRTVQVNELLKNEAGWKLISESDLLHLINTANVDIPSNIAEALFNKVKEGYWEKHTIHRQFTPGMKFSKKEVELNIINLGMESSAKRNKLMGYALLDEELSDLEKQYNDLIKDPNASEKEIKYLRRTLDYSRKFVSGLRLRNNKFMDTFRGVMYLIDLGFFKPPFLFQQSLENFQTVYPLAIGEYDGNIAKASREFEKAGEKAAQLTIKIINEKLGKDFEKDELWDVVKKLRLIEVVAPLGVKVLAGESGDPKIHYSKPLMVEDVVKNTLSAGGQGIEYLTRLHAAALFYKVAKDKGIKGVDNIVKYVSDMIKISKADYSKLGTMVGLNPKNASGLSQKSIARTLLSGILVYRKWATANTGLYRYLWNRSKVAFTTKVLIGIGLGGWKNFPLLTGILAIASLLVNLFRDDDDKTLDAKFVEAEEKLNKAIPNAKIGSLLNRGFGTYFGTDLSGLFAQGSAVPTDVLAYSIKNIKSIPELLYEAPGMISETIFGRPLSFAQDFVSGLEGTISLINGDLTDKETLRKQRNAINLLPSTFKSMLQTKLIKEEGYKVNKRTIINSSSLTDYELALRFAGFMPERFAKEKEKKLGIKKKKQIFSF